MPLPAKQELLELTDAPARLERINRRIVELEAGASLEAGRTVLRELHGLKGEAVKFAVRLVTLAQEVIALLKRDHGIEVKSASSTIERLIFDSPCSRSTKVMGTSHRTSLPSRSNMSSGSTITRT